MEHQCEWKYVELLTDLVRAIAFGDADKVDQLLQFTRPGAAPEPVVRLAEAVGSIVVQNEAKEFRLEMMIEDLLATHLALEKAHHDTLTGLPNRGMFHELLCRECGLAMTQGRELALLFVDLDKFKEVNDGMGHPAGDALLVQVAKRLQHVVGDDGIVSRLGGDEFTVILPHPDQQRTAARIVEDIVRALARPFVLPQGEAHISCSVGISFFPSEAKTPVGLVKNADVAMYRAKADGRNTYHCYTACPR